MSIRDIKWDIIKDINSHAILTNDELSLLEGFSKDRDADIRGLVVEVLYDRDSEKAETILQILLSDKDNMVRVNACDSLRGSMNKDMIEILKKYAICDPYFLVRGYAVSSIADIIVNIKEVGVSSHVSFFKKSLLKEKETWVKIHYYRALYLMEQDVYLSCLLKELHQRNYQNRCLVINLLLSIASEDNKNEIVMALKNRLKIEDCESIAVISSIEMALKELE